jgi:hypothetical protein
MFKSARYVGIFLFLASFLLILMRLAAEQDFQLVESGQPPSFAFESEFLSDGGSHEHVGVGYFVYCLHSAKFNGDGEKVYRRGALLEYWLPLPYLFPNKDASTMDPKLNPSCNR